jgi:hypothetical protein
MPHAPMMYHAARICSVRIMREPKHAQKRLQLVLFAPLHQTRVRQLGKYAKTRVVRSLVRFAPTMRLAIIMTVLPLLGRLPLSPVKKIEIV